MTWGHKDLNPGVLAPTGSYFCLISGLRLFGFQGPISDPLSTIIHIRIHPYPFITPKKK